MTRVLPFDFGSGASYGAGTGFGDIGSMPDIGNVFDIESPGTYDIPFGTDLGLPSFSDLGDLPTNFLDGILGNILGGGDKPSSGMMPGIGLPPLPMDLFSPERVAQNAQRVDIETAKQLQEQRGILNDIAYLTGQSTPEFVNRMEDRFKDYFDTAADRAYDFLFEEPKRFAGKIAATSDKVRNSIDDYLESYSNLNRSTFMNEAVNPSTVSIDPGVYDDQINAFMDRFKNETKAGGLMSYTDEQSKELIRPENKYSREALATAYGSPDIQKAFMTYSA
jgi:hypothetical protein|tara:strand:- start:95 stop:928 length:834 start_codon:yes stop_codon:yes gene_type:complete